MGNVRIHPAVSLRGSRTSGLFMATWGFFIGFAAVALYGPTAAYLREVMGLSGMLVGLLVAAPQLTGSLLRIPFGASVDRFGGKGPMLWLLGLSLIGMGGLVFILFTQPDMGREAYPLILMLGFLSGCGVATFSVGIPQTSYWFPKSKQGTALGAYGGIGNISPGLFTILLPFALAAWGLAGSYLAWFLFLLVGTVVYALFTRDAPYFQLRRKGADVEEAAKQARTAGQEILPKDGSPWQTLGRAAGKVETWALVILYFTSFGGFLALTAWLPTYWTTLHGLDLTTAGLLGGAGFSLLAALIRVYGGVLSERWGGERMAILSFAAVLAGALLLSTVIDFGINLAGALLIALGMGVGNAAVFKMVPKYVPDAVGGASGWVGGLGALGGFVIPPLMGLIAEGMGQIGYARGFIVYIVLAVVSLAIAFALWRRSITRAKTETKRAVAA